METGRKNKETAFIYSTLFTPNPAHNSLFPKIVETLISSGGTYAPEYVAMTSSYETWRADLDPKKLELLLSKWGFAAPPTVFHLRKDRTPSVDVTYVKNGGRAFSSVSIDVESAYLADSDKREQLLTLLRDLYQVLDVSYGYSRTYEMGAHYNKRGKEYSAGTDLTRGIPDVYWANFFGPEYVEMFG